MKIKSFQIPFDIKNYKSASVVHIIKLKDLR